MTEQPLLSIHSINLAKSSILVSGLIGGHPSRMAEQPDLSFFFPVFLSVVTTGVIGNFAKPTFGKKEMPKIGKIQQPQKGEKIKRKVSVIL